MAYLIPIGTSYIVADTASEALDAIVLAEQTGRAVPMPHAAIDVTPIATSTVTNTASAVPSTSPWDRLIAYVLRPARHRQLKLLHMLKTCAGRYVSREELALVVGLAGAPGKNSGLGGILSGIIKQAAAFGLDAAQIVEQSSLGYRAGPLLLEHDLPEVNVGM